MSKIKLIKLRVKAGQKNNWLKWTVELKKRRREVLHTLKKEGMLSEACFISKNGKDIYYFMETTKDFSVINKVFAESKNKIDIEHKKITSKTLKLNEELIELFNFTVK